MSTITSNNDMIKWKLQKKAVFPRSSSIEDRFTAGWKKISVLILFRLKSSSHFNLNCVVQS